MRLRGIKEGKSYAGTYSVVQRVDLEGNLQRGGLLHTRGVEKIYDGANGKLRLIYTIQGKNRKGGDVLLSTFSRWAVRSSIYHPDVRDPHRECEKKENCGHDLGRGLSSAEVLALMIPEAKAR